MNTINTIQQEIEVFCRWMFPILPAQAVIWNQFENCQLLYEIDSMVYEFLVNLY